MKNGKTTYMFHGTYDMDHIKYNLYIIWNLKLWFKTTLIAMWPEKIGNAHMWN